MVPAAMRFTRRVSGPGQFEWMDDKDNVVATEAYERPRLLSGKSRAVLEVPSTSYELRRPSDSNDPYTWMWRGLMRVRDLQRGEEVITPSRPLGSVGWSSTMVLSDGQSLRVRRTRTRRASAHRYSFVILTNGAGKRVLCVRYIPSSSTDPFFLEARLQALVREGCPGQLLLPLVALAGDILTYGLKSVRWPPD